MIIQSDRKLDVYSQRNDSVALLFSFLFRQEYLKVSLYRFLKHVCNHLTHVYMFQITLCRNEDVMNLKETNVDVHRSLTTWSAGFSETYRGLIVYPNTSKHGEMTLRFDIVFQLNDLREGIRDLSDGSSVQLLLRRAEVNCSSKQGDTHSCLTLHIGAMSSIWGLSDPWMLWLSLVLLPSRSRVDLRSLWGIPYLYVTLLSHPQLGTGLL